MTKTVNRLISILAMATLIFASVPVYAAALTTVSDTMSRAATSVDSNHTITFTTPSGVQAGQNFTIAFPSDFSTTSVDVSDIDITDDGGQLTLAGSPSGTTWGAVFGGTGNRTLTVTSATGTIAAGSVIVVTIGTNATGGDQAINNPTTEGTKLITIGVDNAGTANDDSGSLAVAISDGTYDDQFTVTATVDPSITFTLSSSTVGLGVLTVSSVASATTSFTINTNATQGYTVYAYDDGNLRSGLDDINDVANGTTVDAGSEEYGMSTNNAGAALDFPTTVSGNSSALTTSNKACAKGTGPVSSDSTTLTLKAAVSGVTPAGSYQHTVTLISVGNF